MVRVDRSTPPGTGQPSSVGSAASVAFGVSDRASEGGGDRVDATFAPEIEAWLAELEAAPATRRTRRQALGLRHELEDHIHQRLRAHAISGTPPADAITRTLQELGPPIVLAEGLDQVARRHRRSMFMHVAIFGSGAAVAAAITLTIGIQARGTLAVRPAPAVSPSSGALAGPSDDAWATDDDAPRFTINESPIAVDDLVRLVDRMVDTPILVEWAALAEAGLEPSASIDVPVGSVPLSRIMRAVTDAGVAMEMHDEAPTWFEDDGVLTLSTRAVADRRTTMLVSHSIGDIVERAEEAWGVDREETLEEIEAAVRAFVSADDWRENGGGVARLMASGERLFVQAPRRMQDEIEWILDQLRFGAMESLERMHGHAGRGPGAGGGLGGGGGGGGGGGFAGVGRGGWVYHGGGGGSIGGIGMPPGAGPAHGLAGGSGSALGGGAGSGVGGAGAPGAGSVGAGLPGAGSGSIGDGSGVSPGGGAGGPGSGVGGAGGIGHGGGGPRVGGGSGEAPGSGATGGSGGGFGGASGSGATGGGGGGSGEAPGSGAAGGGSGATGGGGGGARGGGASGGGGGRAGSGS
ncbi:MAG: hypothetical protein AB8G96_04025 [Phycisphaerales bacterium]